MAAIKGGRRPYLSLSGPKKSWPTASPIMLVVNPSCTIEELVEKYLDMAGRVGRYMSVTKGPKAVIMPKKTSIKRLEFFFCFM